MILMNWQHGLEEAGCFSAGVRKKTNSAPGATAAGTGRTELGR